MPANYCEFSQQLHDSASSMPASLGYLLKIFNKTLFSVSAHTTASEPGEIWVLRWLSIDFASRDGEECTFIECTTQNLKKKIEIPSWKSSIHKSNETFIHPRFVKFCRRALFSFFGDMQKCDFGCCSWHVQNSNFIQTSPHITWSAQKLRFVMKVDLQGSGWSRWFETSANRVKNPENFINSIPDCFCDVKITICRVKNKHMFRCC